LGAVAASLFSALISNVFIHASTSRYFCSYLYDFFSADKSLIPSLCLWIINDRLLCQGSVAIPMCGCFLSFISESGHYVKISEIPLSTDFVKRGFKIDAVFDGSEFASDVPKDRIEKIRSCYEPYRNMHVMDEIYEDFSFVGVSVTFPRHKIYVRRVGNDFYKLDDAGCEKVDPSTYSVPKRRLYVYYRRERDDYKISPFDLVFDRNYIPMPASDLFAFLRSNGYVICSPSSSFPLCRFTPLS
jgi:hypothetical protein